MKFPEGGEFFLREVFRLVEDPAGSRGLAESKNERPVLLKTVPFAD